jgi:Zn-dependent protease
MLEYIFNLLLMIPIAIISLSVHESAHGYASYLLGDPTARNLGRITMNPLKHFDVIGFICMVLFRVGWAKPVPVNARYYKNPRVGMALTAAAGPISNLLLALIGVIGSESTWLVMRNMSAEAPAFMVVATVFNFFYLFSLCNISLAVFNLIPVPPFDGSRILYVFLPPKYYFGIMKYERYIMIAVLVLFYLNVFDLPLSLATNAIFDGMVKLVELIPIFR